MARAKTRPTAKPVAAAASRALAASEATAHCVMSILSGLGCHGSGLKLAAQAIAFQVASRISVEGRDDHGITRADFAIDIDYEALRLMTSDGRTFEIDPSQPVYGQLSRVLGKLVPNLNALWNRLGVTRRVVAVTYTDEVYGNPDLLERTRAMLGLAPSESDWGGKTPTSVGSFKAGNMAALGFSARVGR